MVVRHLFGFVSSWLGSLLRMRYIERLRLRLFDRALDAEVAYFDTHGSDELLNAVVTQTTYGGQVITATTNVLKELLLVGSYGAVAFVLAPQLTLLTVVVLGGAMYAIQSGLVSAYAAGDRIAAANERVQTVSQSGFQGIRDVKLFDLGEELSERFEGAVNQLTRTRVTLERNQAAIQNFYQLAAALTVFGLLYGALRFTPLSLGELAVFLFAMFRLAPLVSRLSDQLYEVDRKLPHLVRTQRLVAELATRREPEADEGSVTVPDPVDRVALDAVTFAYDEGEPVLSDVSLAAERGEFVALAGPSGAGKSTVGGLVAGLYHPETGSVTANGIPLSRFRLSEWRRRVAVVRQSPHIFNDTLRFNLTVGRRDASEEALDRVCDIAAVTEFLDDLPNGYETELGDDGVRLSGGQRQRVAIARALLKEADVLVLDEATSDLDTELEAQVHGAIESLDRELATLVIAHRLSTVVDADRILTLVDGEVVESGTHDELLAHGGRYATLYAGQVTR
jgi:subfamily B ATP-binding cassette protein MsbA